MDKLPSKLLIMNAEELIRHYQVGERNFSNIEFQDRIDLSNTNLQEINFSGCHFIRANFDRCDFENTVFNNCQLNSCTFQETNLSNVSFQGAKQLNSCNFDSANLSNASFESIGFYHYASGNNYIKFYNANLNKTDFTECKLVGVNFVGINLSNVNLTNAD